MISTHLEVMEQLTSYGSPQSKLTQMLKKGTLIQIRRGLFVDTQHIPPVTLAPVIYGPSYISFRYVLSITGLIPERAYSITSASFGKNKSKLFTTSSGEFHYWPVPKTIYPYGIQILEEQGISYFQATPEKALCDTIYKLRWITTQKSIQALLLDDWRIEKENLQELDRDFITWIAPLYGTQSLRVLAKWFKRGLSDG